MTGAAIADDDPTVLIEARSLYQEKGDVTAGAIVQPVAGARFHRHGTDVVIVTWGAMLGTVLRSADELAARGIHASVLDLRWLRPLDDASTAAAVASCSSRVVIVHEAIRTGGFGAEIASRTTEDYFHQLQALVARIGMADVRVPGAPNLQAALVPDLQRVVAAAERLVLSMAMDGCDPPAASRLSLIG